MNLTAVVTLLLYTGSLAAAAAWATGMVVALLPAGRNAAPPDRSSNAWFLMGISPLLGGIAVAAGCLTSGVLKGLSVIADHCELHPGHPHLCWDHADLTVPSGLLLFGATAGAGLALASMVRVARPLFQVRAVFRPEVAPVPGHEADSDGLLAVASEVPAAFVAGVLKPRICLTSAAVGLLTPEEIQIVVSHEREHIRRRDPLKLLVLRLTACLFPGFRRIEEQWRAAAEMECDWACVRQGSDPVRVSATILKLARSLHSSLPALAYSGGPETVLRRRVERLLSSVQPPDCGGGRWVFLAAAAVLTGCALSAMHHHRLESLLGPLSR